MPIKYLLPPVVGLWQKWIEESANVVSAPTTAKLPFYPLQHPLIRTSTFYTWPFTFQILTWTLTLTLSLTLTLTLTLTLYRNFKLSGGKLVGKFADWISTACVQRWSDKTWKQWYKLRFKK